jgi:hypothetical protein
MRASGAGKNLLPVYLKAANLRRSKDLGGQWKTKIAAAKAAGNDAIVYLNRYEGLDSNVIQRLQSLGLLQRLDDLSDEEFRRAVPQARDSYIVFRPEHIKSAIGNSGLYGPSDSLTDAPGHRLISAHQAKVYLGRAGVKRAEHAV